MGLGLDANILVYSRQLSVRVKCAGLWDMLVFLECIPIWEGGGSLESCRDLPVGILKVYFFSNNYTLMIVLNPLKIYRMSLVSLITAFFNTSSFFTLFLSRIVLGFLNEELFILNVQIPKIRRYPP